MVNKEKNDSGIWITENITVTLKDVGTLEACQEARICSGLEGKGVFLLLCMHHKEIRGDIGKWDKKVMTMVTTGLKDQI